MPTQIMAKGLRIRRDHVIAPLNPPPKAMVKGPRRANHRDRAAVRSRGRGIAAAACTCRDAQDTLPRSCRANDHDHHHDAHCDHEHHHGHSHDMEPQLDRCISTPRPNGARAIRRRSLRSVPRYDLAVAGFPVGRSPFQRDRSGGGSGDIVDATNAQEWLASMGRSPGFCDGVFLAHAHRAEQVRRCNLPMWRACRAFAPRENAIWKPAQGLAFIDIARAAWNATARPPGRGLRWRNRISRAVGSVSASHAIPLAPTLHAFRHALTSNGFPPQQG